MAVDNDNKELFSKFESQSKHEDTLIQSRLTLFFTANAFVFTGYLSLLSNSDTLDGITLILVTFIPFISISISNTFYFRQVLPGEISLHLCWRKMKELENKLGNTKVPKEFSMQNHRDACFKLHRKLKFFPHTYHTRVISLFWLVVALTSSIITIRKFLFLNEENTNHVSILSHTIGKILNNIFSTNNEFLHIALSSIIFISAILILFVFETQKKLYHTYYKYYMPFFLFAIGIFSIISFEFLLYIYTSIILMFIYAITTYVFINGYNVIIDIFNDTIANEINYKNNIVSNIVSAESVSNSINHNLEKYSLKILEENTITLEDINEILSSSSLQRDKKDHKLYEEKKFDKLNESFLIGKTIGLFQIEIIINCEKAKKGTKVTQDKKVFILVNKKLLNLTINKHLYLMEKSDYDTIIKKSNSNEKSVNERKLCNNFLFLKVAIILLVISLAEITLFSIRTEILNNKNILSDQLGEFLLIDNISKYNGQQIHIQGIISDKNSRYAILRSGKIQIKCFFSNNFKSDDIYLNKSSTLQGLLFIDKDTIELRNCCQILNQYTNNNTLSIIN